MLVESYCGYEHLWNIETFCTFPIVPSHVILYCFISLKDSSEYRERSSNIMIVRGLQRSITAPVNACGQNSSVTAQLFWLQFVMVPKSFCNFYPTAQPTRNNHLELNYGILPLLVWFLSQWHGFLSRLGWIRIVLVLDSFPESPRGLQDDHSVSRQSRDE